MIKIILNKGKEQSLKRFHPWVFSGAVKKIQGGEPAEGDVVEVYSSTGEYLGCGHYQIGSITVRILSFDKVAIDQDFWNRAIEGALYIPIFLKASNKPKAKKRLNPTTTSADCPKTFNSSLLNP